jgi:hypothetical protein
MNMKPNFILPTAPPPKKSSSSTTKSLYDITSTQNHLQCSEIQLNMRDHNQWLSQYLPYSRHTNTIYFFNMSVSKRYTRACTYTHTFPIFLEHMPSSDCVLPRHLIFTHQCNKFPVVTIHKDTISCLSTLSRTYSVQMASSQFMFPRKYTEQSLSWEVPRHSSKCPSFMEPTGSFPCPKQPTTGSYPQPHKFSSHPHTLIKIRVFWCVMSVTQMATHVLKLWYIRTNCRLSHSRSL